MNFGEALQALKDGKKVSREGWNSKHMFIYFVQGSKFEVNRPPLDTHFDKGSQMEYLPHIDMYTADKKCVPWLASQSDVLADDWGVVE